jgi:hypothetical protein
VSGLENELRRETSPGRPRLTDSPWFWLLLFANAALIGVAVIGPKYNIRQAGVERRYEARQEIARRAQGQPTADPADSVGTTDEMDPPADSSHIVPLKPLAAALVLLNLFAIVAFSTNHMRLIARRGADSQREQP